MITRITKLLLFVLLPLSFIVAFGQIKSAYAATGINRAINFQGKIVNKTDSTNITNGNYSFTFKLYDAASGGTQLPSGSAWSETQTLIVTDGLFQATIGGTTTFPQTLDFNSDSIYLDITFDGETFGSRVRLTAVPYAFNAEKVNGLTVTATTGTLTIPNSTTISFAGANNLTLSTTGITGLTLPQSGTITVGEGQANFLTRWISATQLSTGVSYDTGTSLGVGTTNPLGLLTVGVGQTSAFFVMENGNVGVGITSGHAKFHVRAVGATNPVAFYVDYAPSSQLGFAVLNNLNVGIGTTTPTTKLEVVRGANGQSTILVLRNNYGQVGDSADIDFHITSGGANGRIGTIRTNSLVSGAADIVFSTYNGSLTEKMRLSSAGSLGIGTSAPASKLTVAGNASIGIAYTGVAAPTDGLIVQGNVGIGSTGRSGYALDVGGNVNIGSTITVNGFKFGTSTTSGHVLTVDSSGVGTWQAASGGVTGGAVNNVARWLSATQLSTGVSYDDGSLFGIGTTAPSSTRAYIMGTGTSTAFAFRIADSAGTDRLSVRDNGNIGIGTTSGSFRLQVKETRTDTGSGSQSMIYNELTVNPGDNSSTNFITSWNRLFTPTGSTATFNIINGLTNETIHQAASTVTTARGLTGKVKIDSSDGNSIITDANSIEASHELVTLGTISKARGFLVNTPSLGTGGSVTQFAGLNIGNLTTPTNSTYILLGQSTLLPYGNWGIYNASTWDNYFAGNIGIGNSSPGSNKLLVAGSTVIGIGYTGVTAPTNGLAVQGNVGIGSTGRAGFVLDVGGNVNIGTGATVGSSLTVLGTSNLAGTTASQFYSSGSITGGTSLTIVGNSNLAGTTVNQLYNSNVSTLAGNVGIGTTGGAGYKLYVAGAIYGTTLVQNGNTVCDSSGNCGGGVTGGATNYLARWISATQLSTGVSYDNGSFVGIGYTAGTGAALLVNGNVGIGVTNPGNKLTVLTGFSVASAANSNYVTTAAPSGGAIIEGLTGIGTTSPKNRLDVAGAVAIGALPSVALPQANMLYVSGNVGIGNSNPTYQLEVSGKSRFGGTLAASHTVDIVASGSDTPLAIQGGNSVIEFWKDTTPTKAMSLGLAVPGGTVGEDFIFSAYNGSSWGEKVRFTGSGNVGIGFSAPASKLTVAGNLSVGAGYSGVAAPTNGLLVEGNVGLGTTNPSALLSLVSVGSTAPTGGLFSLDWSPLTASTLSSDLFSINIGYSGTALTLFSIKDNGSSLFSVSEAIVDSNLPAAFNASGDVAVAYDINFTNPTASYIKSNAPLSIQSGEVFNSSDLTLRTYNAGNIVFDLGTTGKIVTPGSNDLLISPGGGVGIGSTDPGSNTLKVVGSLCVKSNDGNCAGSTAGTIYATTTTISSADYAENYVSGQELEPGDVVVGETGGNDQAVVRAERENDKNILGIVSTSPGVLLNSDVATDSAHPKAYPIALSGRVPLKVSTLNGPIKEGDFLTSSSVPGVAVKAIKAGAVVAKALSPFQSNELREVGTIMSFVHIGWYDPDVYISETGDYSVKRETVNGLTIYRTRTSANAVIQRNGIFNSLVASYIMVGQLKAEDILVNGVSLTDTLNTLSAKTASQSAQLVDLAVRVTSLEGGGTSQENVLAASDSADLQTLLSRVEFLEASLFNSVSSASGAFEASESAIFDKKVIADALTVIGHTNLNSLAVTATFSAGLVRIDGYDTSEATPAASINSVVGPLRLQSFALEGLEFVGGKVKMSRKGDITLTDGKIIGNRQFTDKTVIKEGQLEGRVDREWEIPPSGIILTPSYNTRAWVEDISPTGFVIRVDSTPTSDREIYWMATWNE